ncbi:MAG TPA: FtsQ-type POTRA domain-containing protein [Gaiellaceae bacterium]|nr:FtsQ-type POTRA domain-containing protein [Gaiellaceae bacterium]
MVLQQALALVRPQALPSPAGLWRRAVVVLACAVAALGILYVAARETPLFALRTVEVQGVSGDVRASVLREVDELRGDSLVALDGGALARRLEALPSVLSVGYDRAFPHTLRLVVRPERPVAVVVQGDDDWVVSVRGRVIGPVETDAEHDLPRIRYRLEQPLTTGGFVPDAGTRMLLSALAAAPRRMALPIRSARLEEDDELTLVLTGEGGTRPLLLLGEASDVALKLRVAALVLRKLGAEERASLAYLDVSLPDRPVASSNPKVSS